MEKTVPQAEMEHLKATVNDALWLVSEGQLAAGYDVLLAGRQHARAAVDRGDRWGNELLEYWQAALDRFCERFGLTWPPDLPRG